MSMLKEQLIGGATIVGTVVACVAIGYAIGKDTNDGLVNFLPERNQVAEKTEVQLWAEISALKLEIQGSRPPPGLSGGAVLEGPAASGGFSAKPRPEGETSARLTLRSGGTGAAFDGKILISLIGVNFQGSPLRHVVTASVGAPGRANKALEGIDVGFSLVYEGYEIRLVASDTLSGTFLITKLPG